MLLYDLDYLIGRCSALARYANNCEAIDSPSRIEPHACTELMQGFCEQLSVAHLGKGVVEEYARLLGVWLEQHGPQHAVRWDALVDRLAPICGPPQLRHL